MPRAAFELSIRKIRTRFRTQLQSTCVGTARASIVAFAHLEVNRSVLSEISTRPTV